MSLVALALVGAAASPSLAAAPRKTASAKVGTQAQKDAVFRLYWAYFLRNPDASGLDYWVGQVRSRGLAGVSNGFAQSSEFVHRYGQLGNSAFVKLIYSNVFSRDVDASGLSYWTSALNHGKSRGLVMIGFSESGEFRRLTNTGPGLCDDPEQCSRTLFGYWAAGTQRARTLAGFVASPEAVNTLFSSTYDGADGWEFSGCEGSAGHVECTATSKTGMTVTASMSSGAGLDVQPPPYHIGSVFFG